MPLKAAALPYRDPLRYAIGEGYFEYPNYRTELKMAIEVESSLQDPDFRGIHHELPFTDDEWTWHVVVGTAHPSFCYLAQHESSRVDLRAQRPDLYEDLPVLQKLAMDIYSGYIPSVPVYMGGWV